MATPSPTPRRRTTRSNAAANKTVDVKPVASTAASTPSSSSAAREAAGSKSYPSDLTIVGIIDHWEPDPPKTAAPSPSPSPSSKPAGGKAS